MPGRTTINTVLVVACALLWAATTCGVGWTAPATNPVVLGSGKVRTTINFPADANLGSIWVYQPFAIETYFTAPAQGRVQLSGPNIYVLRPGPGNLARANYWDLVPENIEGLDLRDVDFHPDLLKKILPRFKSLRYLGLADSGVDDRIFQWLPQLQKLELLNISGTPVTGSALSQLAKLPQFWALQASRATIRPENFKYLPSIPKLALLQLQETTLNDDTCKYVAQCKSLQSLFIPRNRIGAKGLANLAPLRNKLSALDVTGCLIDDEALKSIGKFEHLQSLGMRLIKMSKYSGAGIAYLKPLKSLTWLDVRDSYIGDDVLESIGKNCPSLTALFCDGCKNLTDKGFGKLPGLVNLTRLDALDTNFGDSGLEAATHWKALQANEWGATEISDAGLAKFCASGLPNLISLHIDNCARITDNGLVNLYKLPALHEVILTGTEITDAAVPHLIKCKKLGALGVAHTNMTKAGVAKLRAAMPNCKIGA